MRQTVKLVYGRGKRDALARAAAALMEMQMAFYYSKDLIRVKTRRPERVRTVRNEFAAQRLKVYVKVCDYD